MKIIFLSMVHLDSIRSAGIYGDLLSKFRDQGHELYIVFPCERKYHQPSSLTHAEGVHFLSVRTGNLMEINLVEKGLATVTLEHLFKRAIKRFLSDEHFDLILYATPPITLSRVIAYLKKRDNAASYLLLKDIFPQNAVDLGMFTRNSLFYWYFRRKEKQLYYLSDYIGCMSPANQLYLLHHNPEITTQQVEISPNTITPPGLEILTKNRTYYRSKYGIPLKKTVFVYGGNLGKPQGIDFLIDCIKRNERNESSFILIVGFGTEYHKLKSFFDNEQPLHSKLLSSLPKEDYESLLSVCDVGLIFLDYRFTIPNFPSRLLSYMKYGLPVLSATDPCTDVGDIIEAGQFGYQCLSNDVESFNQCVHKLMDESLRKTLGQNARAYLEKNYTTQVSYDAIMSHFEIN